MGARVQIDLSEGPIGDDGVCSGPLVFLVIADKVLNGGGHAFGL